jgi:hypothetical protein
MNQLVTRLGRTLCAALLVALVARNAPEATARDRLSVVDFDVSGDVGIQDAGKSVAALLLPKFGNTFQLVERMQLAAILAEHDLAMADIAKNPALLRGKKIEGVRFLVVGTVVRLGRLSVSARLVEVSSGDIIQTAEVSADDAHGLETALGELAKILQMTNEEKDKYLKSRKERESDRRPGVLLIEADESHLYDFVGDRDFFWNRDLRFRGAGKRFGYTVQVWPADQLKEMLKGWKEGKDSARETGLPEPFIALGVKPRFPKDMSDVKAVEQEVSKTLQNGAIAEIGVHSAYATSAKPLELRVPAGRYYLAYYMYLDGPAQSGYSTLTVGNPTAGGVAWGPLTATVEAGKEARVRVTPYLTNTVVCSGPEVWFEFLTTAGLGP